MNLISWSPFRELDSLFDRYSREAFPARGSLLGEEAQWKPAASITESDDEYTIKADLPAVERQDIDVNVENGLLTIKGERKVEKSSDDERVHRRETFYGAFSRSFSVPDNVDEKNISAVSKNGVLTVHLPKLKEERKETLSIRVT